MGIPLSEDRKTYHEPVDCKRINNNNNTVGESLETLAFSLFSHTQYQSSPLPLLFTASCHGHAQICCCKINVETSPWSSVSPFLSHLSDGSIEFPNDNDQDMLLSNCIISSSHLSASSLGISVSSSFFTFVHEPRLFQLLT